MNFRCCNLQSKQFEEVNMFHKILVAMDTSTIGKSVFDEVCLGKATDPVSCCTFCPLKKKANCTFSSLEYYSGLSGKTWRSSSGRRLKSMV